ALELLVEHSVHRDHQAIHFCDGPARPRAPLDEHLVGPELVLTNADAPARQRLELARGERGANRAELLSELRAEHRQVGLDPHVGRLYLAELDLLDAQLVADLIGVARSAAHALRDEP